MSMQTEPLGQSLDAEHGPPHRPPLKSFTHMGLPSLVAAQMQLPLFGQRLKPGVVQLFGTLAHTDPPGHCVHDLAVVCDVRLEARGHVLLAVHATPALQHRRLVPRPHGVVPDGHPQRPLKASTHAMPLLQQEFPHGVVPFGQQHFVLGSEQASPAWQHPDPQAAAPAGQVTASPRNGLSTVAPAAAAAAAPNSLRKPRRLGAAAIALDSSSNRSLTSPPRIRRSLLA